ncbi:MAG: winged helix-turn-helix domain-containing protein [Pyrinomonadaceae bacterium]|nr:winged helix-turn-helix domain-containing protein [Pyrinomonadaceae bacterium]
MSEQNHHIYEFGPFRLDAQKRRLLRGGEPVKLFPKDFDTLLALVEHSGEVIDKDVLIKRLWGDTIVEDGNLATYISHLRKALGERPGEHDYIVTVPGKGYRFVAGVRGFDELIVHERTRAEIKVEETVATRREAGAVDRTSSRGVGAIDREPAPAARWWRRRSRTLLVVSVLLIGAVTSFILHKFLYLRLNNDGAAAVPFRELEITRLTNSGKTTSAAISPDGQYIVHSIQNEEGQSLWLRQVATASNVQIVPPAEVAYWGLTFSPDGGHVYCVIARRNKGDTTLVRVPVLGGPTKELMTETGPISFSPDGRWIAFLTSSSAGGSSLIVTDPEGVGARTLATRQQPDFFKATITAPAWSPDGKTIACAARVSDNRGNYETVVGVGVEDGAERELTDRRWHHVGPLSWLADGGGLLVTAQVDGAAPQQIWHLPLTGGEATRITHDLNDYEHISLAADSGTLAALQTHHVSSVWVAPDGDAARAKQIAGEVGWLDEIAWTPDGRIVYRSNDGGESDIWVMDADGGSRIRLTVQARVSRGLAVSPDGRYVIFSADQAGRFHVWRVGIDGGGLKRLTEGDGEIYPQVSPDGGWVVYQQGEGLVIPTAWMVSVHGGTPMRLVEPPAQRPTVSPDGKLVAYYYLDPDLEGSHWGIGLVPLGGGLRLKRFDFPPTVLSRAVRWSPDGRSLAYLNSPGGVSNVWLQPLDGTAPRQLTDFKDGRMKSFEWSRDGKHLAFVRGVETSDVVLIKNRDK